MNNRIVGFSESESEKIHQANREKDLAKDLGIPTARVMMRCFVDFSFVIELLKDKNKYDRLAAKLKMKTFW